MQILPRLTGSGVMDSEDILVNLEVYLITLFSKIFCFCYFFGMGQVTKKHTYLVRQISFRKYLLTNEIFLDIVYLNLFTTSHLSVLLFVRLFVHNYVRGSNF